MSNVTFEGVSKTFGGVAALDNLNLAIESGEFVSLLGPSGSGKTTTLNLLAGLLDADGGTIRIDGRDVTPLPPDKRDIAMVFQNYALYPHMTVFENIAFPLRARRPRPSEAEIERRVDQAAGTLGIGDLLARYPKEISGGQQQRVALGRAMIRDPKVFLLDEPLSNLDARLRIRMRHDLKALHNEIKSTIVYVTHDQAEAMTLSSRIAVFNKGKLQQFGTPDEIYNRPVNAFVANFVGDRETNFIDGTLAARDVGLAFTSGGLDLHLARPVPRAAVGTGPARIGLRPEAITPTDETGRNIVEAEVVQTELAGPELFFYARLAGGVEVGSRCTPAVGLVKGQAVRLRFDEARIHIFDPATGVCISHGGSAT